MVPRSIFLILLHASLWCQFPNDPLPVDIRQRVIDDRQIMVIVDIRNETGKIITRLDGFLYASTLSGKAEPERHLILVAPYESLSSGYSRTESTFYPLDPLDPWDFTFQISHIEFRGDPKVYTYHPKVGFIRIE